MAKPKAVLLDGERPLSATVRLGLLERAICGNDARPGVECCYFIGFDDDKARIGYTSNLGSRLKDYASYWPSAPEVFGLLRGGRDLERLLHGIFREYQLEREWYRHEGDLWLFTNDVEIEGLLCAH